MLRVESLDVDRDGAQVLRGIDLVVDDGEAVAVIGANGAGKSTLLRTICGLHVASGGSVRYRGRDLAGIPAHAIARRGVAFVPSDRRVFGRMSVLENLVMGAFPRRAARSRLDEVTRLFPRLAERRRQLAGTLSGGEQQMLAIGRALMADPFLLILDEPSSGLAPVVAEETYAALGRIREANGTSVLVAEQQVPLALGFCDRAYVVELGRIEREGRSDAIAADPGVRRAYLGIR